MKKSRPILAMLAFLALGFLADYVFDFIISGESGFNIGPLPYYWLALLCQVIYGALFLLFLYFTVMKEWLTHGSAITYIVVGGLILFWTPLWVTFNNVFPNLMDSIYLKNPGFMLPAFWARSFFVFTALLVVVTGVYTLLPKPKKRKK